VSKEEQLELPLKSDVAELAHEVRQLTSAIRELIRMVKMEQANNGSHKR
jgi:hypothetical protein